MVRTNTAAWNRVRYTLYAPFYDLFVRYLDRGRGRALELLDVRPGERVLLVGCGTGLDLDHLPAGAEVTAIDYTPAMVERTWARARVLGRPVRAEVMDAQQLELPDGSFDCVVLHLILAVVPDAEACAREAARVLRPGGRASIFDKFLPDEARPSALRSAANLVMGTLATEINRRLGPLLRAGGLERVHREPSLLGGTFQVALARKPGSPSSPGGV